MTMSTDERVQRLHARVAAAIYEGGGDRHVHASSEFAVTIFEIRGRKHREFTTFAIDQAGRIHHKNSRLDAD